jgi:hypothetical protein
MASIYLFGFTSQIVGISFPGSTGGPPAKFVPYKVALTLDWGYPLPAGGADQGPTGNIFQFILGVWKIGANPGINAPIVSTTGGFILEHNVLITLAGGISFSGAYLPEDSTTFRLSVGTPGTLALLCYNSGTQESLSAWHAQAVITPLAMGAGLSTVTSPLSPNIGLPEPYITKDGDLGALGGSVIGNYAVNIMPISFGFYKPTYAVIGQGGTLLSTDTGP